MNVSPGTVELIERPKCIGKQSINYVAVFRMFLQEINLFLSQKHTHTHTRVTALCRDYPGEPVPER